MNQKQKGIMFIILAALSFATMTFFIQLAGEIHFVQKSLFRNMIAMIFAALVIVKNKSGFAYQKGNLKYLLLRSFFGTAGVFFNFYAIEFLILSDATMISKLTPFFAIIFSFFLLKEKIKLWESGAIIVAFIGSLLIINPNFIMNLLVNGKMTSAFNNLPSLMGVLGAMSAGMAYTLIRILGMRGEKGSVIVFFFSAFSTIVTLPMVVMVYEPMEIREIICLICMGIAAALGQFAVTAAYSNAPAKEISIYDYSQILFSAFYGFTFFGQIPSQYSIMGYGIIIGAAIFMFVKSNKKINETEKIV